MSERHLAGISGKTKWRRAEIRPNRLFFPREMADAMEIEAEAETTSTEQPTKADKAAAARAASTPWVEKYRHVTLRLGSIGLGGRQKG